MVTVAKIVGDMEGFGPKIFSMDSYFDVEALSVERLLTEWRWLCPQTVELVARNAFGDLYLQDEEGRILRLDITVGQLAQVAESPEEFQDLATRADFREQWFAKQDEQDAAQQGLKPGQKECIAFKVPLVFAGSGKPNNAYVADLYEQVAFLGDLHRQLKDVPDGGKIQLKLTE